MWLVELIKAFLNSPVVSTLIWALLIFVIFFILRTPIVEFVQRLRKLEAAGLKATAVPPDFPEVRPVTHDYWLGHDVMFTICLLAQGADVSEILASFDRSINHADRRELRESADSLRNLQGWVRTRPRPLSPEDRESSLRQLEYIRMEIAKELGR